MNVTVVDTSVVNSTESVTIKISEANHEQFNVMQILQLLIVSCRNNRQFNRNYSFHESQKIETQNTE